MVAVLVLSALPLMAQGAGDDARAKDAAEYAKHFGVGADEAARRLELQRAASDLEGALVEQEAATFAGLWIQHKPEYRIVVRFTDRAAAARLEARVAGGPLAGLVETRHARFSLAELEAKQEELRGNAKKAGVEAESDIDIVGNRLEVYTLEPQKLSARMAAARVRVPEGAAVKRVNQLSSADLRGGEGLYGCTAGFAVRSTSTGELGISTAAHCDDEQYYQGVWLPFRAQKYSGDHDVQWNSTCDRVSTSNSIITGIGDRAITQTRSRTNQTVGTFLCKYGIATGRTCGTISSKSYDIGAGFNGTFIRVDGWNLRAPGDSGGPWFVENIAYGIHHGYPGSDPNDAIYMAINYISAIGAEVLTYTPGVCNTPPVANLTYTKVGFDTYSFNASGSYDPDGSIVTYDWDFGDGTWETTTTPYVTHAFGSGQYTISVLVNDNEGAYAWDSVYISTCGGAGQPQCPF